MIKTSTENSFDELSILIASGQTPVRLNIERALNSRHHQIMTATSGKNAIEIDKDSMSNLIIADATLPDMPIEEMLYQIREYRRLMKDVVINEYVPVILIASVSEKLNEAQLKKLGVLVRLNKPLNMNLISGCVDKILSGELKLEKQRLININILDPEKRALEYFSKMLKAEDVSISTLKDVY